MYAILEVGSKQYKVQEGDSIEVEKIETKQKSVTLDKVLLVSDKTKLEIGKPYLKSVLVTADIVSQMRGPKTICYKYRRRKSSERTIGHRQNLTRLKIKEIKIG
ncbi:MAG: 50S ribosomal protein L21 [Candidatus Omnitrophota bacterium]